MWCMGIAAPWHVESSQTRDQTQVPCVGRWILNHWTTREVPRMGVLKDQTLKKYVAAIAAVWTSGVELGEGVVRVLDV